MSMNSQDLKLEEILRNLKFGFVQIMVISVLGAIGMFVGAMNMSHVFVAAEQNYRYVVLMLRFNPFFPTIPTFAVRETVSVGIMGPRGCPP